MTSVRNGALAGVAALALIVTAACGAVTGSSSDNSTSPAPNTAASGETAIAETAPSSDAAAAEGTETQDAGSQSDFHLAPEIAKRVADGETLQIRLSYHDPALAFAVPIKEGMAKAAKELGVNAELIGPTGGDAGQQVAQLQTLITQKKVDGIAVSSASNDALKPVIAQAYQAGIPIISFNTNNPGSDQMAFIGQDLVASGKTLGEQVLKALDGKTGKVVVVSVDSGAGWSNDRFSGFSSAVNGAGLDIVGPVNTGNEPSAAYNTVQSTMAGNKDAIALVSLDCCSFTAGAKWAQQTGQNGKILVAGFDVQPQTVDFIKGGTAAFTISQAPGEQGYQAVKVLVNFLKDGTPMKDVDTGVQLVTKANIDKVPVEG